MAEDKDSDNAEYAKMPPSLRAIAAHIKGTELKDESNVVAVPFDEVFPRTAEARRKKQAFTRETERKILQSAYVGEFILNKGVFFCYWGPKDRNGNALGEYLYVFAAPTDLTSADGQTNLMTFDKAVEEVGKLRDWHGHDGILIRNDAELFKALKDGSAIGKWFIPPIGLLGGRQNNRNVADRDGYNLFDQRHKGYFCETFTTKIGYVPCYFSCTESNDMSNDIECTWFTDNGSSGARSRKTATYRCRPCRVECEP